MELLNATVAAVMPPDATARAAARARLEQLTMPHWALGRLMDLAVDLAGMTGSIRPPVARKTVVVMAADHGVCAEGVSKYPSEVTVQMALNFLRGGAGVNALAGVVGAHVDVVDMGMLHPVPSVPGAERIRAVRIRAGTANLARGPAMSRDEAVSCVEAGIRVARERAGETDVFATGDMGIGNTTASAAIASVLTGATPAEVTGRGTGLDDAQLAHKTAVIEQALRVNAPDPADALDVLQKVGGLEIGGLAGLILGAAAARRPVLVDGFISTAAALVARALCPACVSYMIAAHRSVEPGHAPMHRSLGLAPLLDLGMRLGEGTGAVLAMGLLDAAVAVLTRVATFEQAGVSGAGT